MNYCSLAKKSTQHFCENISACVQRGTRNSSSITSIGNCIPKNIYNLMYTDRYLFMRPCIVYRSSLKIFIYCILIQQHNFYIDFSVTISTVDQKFIRVRKPYTVYALFLFPISFLLFFPGTTANKPITHGPYFYLCVCVSRENRTTSSAIVIDIFFTKYAARTE